MRSPLFAALLCATAGRNVLAASNAKFCSTVKGIVASAKAQRPALDFCSSTVTSTQICQPTPATLQKVARESKSKPKPACLKGFSKPAEISSACKCLPLTTTVTPTSTVRVAVTPASFKLKATGSPANGQFMQIRNLFSTFDTTLADAQVVSLNNTGGLRATVRSLANDGSTYFARAIHDCGGSEAAAWYDPPGFACDNDWICRVEAGADQTCNLACEGRPGWVNNQVESDNGLVNQWYLSPSEAGVGNARVAFTPLVVPV
ncbi:hypothetical protein CLAFUW4_05188 [Fulvia fulva]|uniref:Uncharacterized protein n=1 Tax=Passalora fulva TaxID=5499 RepID=A0A9Q8PI16_PASFU|nr:uncharacterized protein CLAFUR5_11718 [Fulvia fulva]KAK4626568.1 hypothetical protein CLAFUR4_05174 [Fulvia fulva]KAK4627897.1 hypothetical protein CLAFUR0_05180 [Fulvia fulva]UJO22845.1 hypothetical protein CLAFUR5_11718 [Fulvia fulva]WPV13963.1 hypothetical protein CLAFUW4_05188 [Fulvia fulva]WPV28463.1 hypothetical protein CLAFUW7_05184 [Fulvia fulva]